MSIEKIVIYTGLFDNYDSLNKPVYLNKNLEYICFTNNRKLKSKFWKIILLTEKESGIFLNRKIKLLPHLYLKMYRKSIYIDANIILLKNPMALISYLNNYDFVLFQHPLNHTYLNEIQINYENKKINKLTYDNLLKKHSNYIFFNKLSTYSIPTNRILIRNHLNIEVIDLMEKCWNDFDSLKIYRDQLILPYLLIKNEYKIKIISPKYSFVTYYVLRPHINYSFILKLKFYMRFFIFEYLIRIIVKIKNL